MSKVSGDFPSRKKRPPSLHVFDATAASSSATVKDAQFFDVSASPSSAPTSGTDGKTLSLVNFEECEVKLLYLRDIPLIVLMWTSSAVQKQ